MAKAHACHLCVNRKDLGTVGRIIKPRADLISKSSVYEPSEESTMDTLHFEPRSFHSRQVGRLFGDDDRHPADEMNLSDIDVFMLRGRRLQAQVIGGALRRAFARLGRLLRASGSAQAPGGHRHA
jgi:hypothetical protein